MAPAGAEQPVGAGPLGEPAIGPSAPLGEPAIGQPAPLGKAAIGDLAAEREPAVGEPAVGEPAPVDGDSGAAPPRIARAAALIAGLTLASRLVGFARILVFGYAVGFTLLGAVYQTANTTPNIIFEIVANGALAALVVPLVAGAVSRRDRDEVGRTASGLLTWVLLLLVPIAVLVGLIAHPVIWLLEPHGTPDEVRVGTGMLRVFAPQLPLYGVGIVMSGVLQAHRRFAWPVLAPLLSSLTVIGAYLAFAAAEPGRLDIPAVGIGGQLILSVGTTLGVVVLSLSLIIPLRRLGLRLRPTLRLDDHVRRSVRGLAGVAVITAASQQLTLALIIALANWDSPKGSLVVFTQAQTVYLVPWAVLAVPVATSAYPALATAVETGAAQRFRETLASATRSVLLLSALGAAALVGLAGPIAWILAHLAKAPQAGTLTAAIAGFAPGLLGYGLFALHSRALYARRDNRFAALATLSGWGGVAVVGVLVALLFPARDRVPALAASNSAGMLVMGAVLVTLIRRRVGAGALAGVSRAAGTAVLAGTLAALAGIVVRWPLTGTGWGVVSRAPGGTPGYSGVVAGGILSGVTIALVFLGVAVLVDRHDVRPMLARFARRAGAGRLARRTGAGRIEHPATQRPEHRAEATRSEATRPEDRVAAGRSEHGADVARPAGGAGAPPEGTGGGR
nr:lipid II flippase MurJ [Rugosimonospora africana]